MAIFAAGVTNLVVVYPGPNERTGPSVTQAHRAFSLLCRVEVNVKTNAERIWHLLTDAKGFPRWNSTVPEIEGQIRQGQQIRVHVPGTDRTFTPRVSGVVPTLGITWTGGFAPMFKGVRTFLLRPSEGGSTDFVMGEPFLKRIFKVRQKAWRICALIRGRRSAPRKVENYFSSDS